MSLVPPIVARARSLPCRRRPGPALLFTLTLALSMTLTGCKSLGTTPTEIANDILPVSPIIPDYRLPVSPSLSIPVEALLAAAILYYVVDPLAPNWEVQERQIAPNLVHLVLRKKRLATGGDGEAPQIIRRRATELALKAGMGDYQLVEYTESVESETLGARKVTTALVRLTEERRWRIQ